MRLIVICVALTGATSSPALVRVGVEQPMQSLSRLVIVLTGQTGLPAFRSTSVRLGKAD